MLPAAGMATLRRMARFKHAQHPRDRTGKFAAKATRRVAADVDLVNAFVQDPRYRAPDAPDLYKTMFQLDDEQAAARREETVATRMATARCSLAEPDEDLAEMKASVVAGELDARSFRLAAADHLGTALRLAGIFQVADDLRFQSLADYDNHNPFFQIDVDGSSDLGPDHSLDVVFGYFTLGDEDPDDYDPYDPYDHLEFEDDHSAWFTLNNNGSWSDPFAD